MAWRDLIAPFRTASKLLQCNYSLPCQCFLTYPALCRLSDSICEVPTSNEDIGNVILPQVQMEKRLRNLIENVCLIDSGMNLSPAFRASQGCRRMIVVVEMVRGLMGGVITHSKTSHSFYKPPPIRFGPRSGGWPTPSGRFPYTYVNLNWHTIYLLVSVVYLGLTTKGWTL